MNIDKIEQMTGEEARATLAKQKLHEHRWKGLLFVLEDGETIVVASKIVHFTPSELIEGGTRIMFDNGSFLDIKDSVSRVWEHITDALG